MSLSKGDHLLIKRNGLILTPDVGEAYHEFEVLDYPEYSPVEKKEFLEENPGIAMFKVYLKVIK